MRLPMIIRSLEDEGSNIDELLEETWVLVMCSGNHRNQAAHKKEAWLERVSNRTLTLSQMGDEVSNSHLKAQTVVF